MDNTYFDRERPQLNNYAIGIYINQVGYQCNAKKIAIITIPTESFIIKKTDDSIAFIGSTVLWGYDNDSADIVYKADFSELMEPGSYYIEAEGVRSVVFCIDDNVYNRVFDDVQKAYHYLRCGCELNRQYIGKYVHPVCHIGKAKLYSDSNVELDVTGGWHDAGDYGRYVTAGACAVAHLLYSYAMYPDMYNDSDSMPFILDECRYELEWLCRMQAADGGVYHKATTMRHAPFVMPQDDTAQMYVFPVSSMATADFVGVCALAYNVYRDWDIEFAKKLLAAAECSMDWLLKNPQFVPFENPEGCNTGGYGEATDIDNRLWAYAQMYVATGEQQYKELFDKQYNSEEYDMTTLGYGNMAGLAGLAFIVYGANANLDYAIAYGKEYIAKAELLKELSDACGYGVSISSKQYGWGSNMTVLKNGMIFAIADYVESKQHFMDYAAAQLHYVLGVNATGYSYVTGAGAHAYKNPHLRPAFADGIDECIAGMVSGGPNQYRMDPDAQVLVPEGTPPMKSYADDVGCFSLNEITIYWNSPAVFLMSAIMNSVK